MSRRASNTDQFCNILQLELVDLMAQAKSAIQQHLTAGNIVHELFGDFTWRSVLQTAKTFIADCTSLTSYPEILTMEAEIFYEFSEDLVVQEDLRKVFTKVAARDLPHGSLVLESLFKVLVSKNGPSARRRPMGEERAS